MSDDKTKCACDNLCRCGLMSNNIAAHYVGKLTTEQVNELAECETRDEVQAVVSRIEDSKRDKGKWERRLDLLDTRKQEGGESNDNN